MGVDITVWFVSQHMLSLILLVKYCEHGNVCLSSFQGGVFGRGLKLDQANQTRVPRV